MASSASGEEEEAAPVDSLASDGQHEAVHLVPLPSGALTKETNDEKLAAAAEEEARLAAQTKMLLGELDSWATGAITGKTKTNKTQTTKKQKRWKHE